MKKLSKFILVFFFMILCFGIISMPMTFALADPVEENQVDENNDNNGQGNDIGENNDSNENKEPVVVSVKSVTELKSVLTKANAANIITIENDIDLAGGDFTPEEPMGEFTGVFDGNGHTIKNVKLQKDGLFYGIFPKAKNATIKNLRIEGDVILDYENESLQEVYAGVLIGYGENVTIENCEISSVTIYQTKEVEGEKQLTDEIFLNSDLNFGLFAGKIKSDSGRSTISIKNCVSNTDITIKMTNNSTFKVGGIVGENEQSIIINSLSFGNINVLSGLSATPEVEKYQFVGGIVGYMFGTYSKVQNTCFGGLIVIGKTNDRGEVIGGLTGLNAKKGAIVGGVSSISTPNAQNVYFDYWTDGSLNCVGDGLSVPYSKSKRIDVINKDFLTTTDNFNGALPGYDFNYIWTMKDSQIILQKFLTFNYKFADTLDRNGVLESATFVDKSWWCSESKIKNTENYNLSYDDCNPFAMISEEFGDVGELSKHNTSIQAQDAVIANFNSLADRFSEFLTAFSSEDEQTTTKYTSFYNKATEIYNTSLVPFTKNVTSDMTKSAVIGLKKDYIFTLGNEVFNELNTQEIIAKLFGYSSYIEFKGIATNLVSAYNTHRTNIEESKPTTEAFDNGCFYTENKFFIFPIAVKNDLESQVLMYLILDDNEDFTNNNASIWVNDITAVLSAINHPGDYHTEGVVDNELICKNVLFINGPYYTYEYNEEVKMEIVLKEDAKQFYRFGSLYLNSKNVAEDLYSCTKTESGSYIITLYANDMTDGIYSFLISPVVFECEIVSENIYDGEGNLQDQGGVKISGASSSVRSMIVSFSKNAATKSITAVGKGIYIFDYWTLYYEAEKDIYTQVKNEDVTADNYTGYYIFTKTEDEEQISDKKYYTRSGENGSYTFKEAEFGEDVYEISVAPSYVEDGEYFEKQDWVVYQIEDEEENLVEWRNPNSTINIVFGNGQFNKVFRLVAHFTDKGAVTLKFPTIDTKRIASLKINGNEMVGTETVCMVSPNTTSTLELVTNKGFELKYEDFINRMGLTYGDKTFVMTSNPILNEESGTTTYKFNIVMKNAKNLNKEGEVEDKKMEFLLLVEEDKSANSGTNTMLIVVIVVVVVVVAAGVATFIIIKKKKGGKGKGKSKKSSQKKTTYNDYYI